MKKPQDPFSAEHQNREKEEEAEAETKPSCSRSYTHPVFAPELHFLVRAMDVSRGDGRYTFLAALAKSLHGGLSPRQNPLPHQSTESIRVLCVIGQEGWGK